MRRTKVEITPIIKEMVETTVQFIPNEVELLKNKIKKLESLVSDLHLMKHKDYVNTRKELQGIINDASNMRKNVLQIHKIFTK